MGAALGWGTLAAWSLVLGAFLGIARAWPDRLVGLVLAFGAGALIAAVSFELAEEGVQLAGIGPVAVSMALGALTYFVCDAALDRLSALMESRRRGDTSVDRGPALAPGAVLDGIPEQLVLGIGLATGARWASACSWRSSCRTCPRPSDRPASCGRPEEATATCCCSG